VTSEKTIVEWFGGAVLSEQDWRTFFEYSVRFSQEAIHVVAAVVILFVAAAALRKPVSSLWPWMVLLLLASLNALGGLGMGQGPQPGVDYGEAARDLLLTMAVPTFLMLSVRWAPGLFRPPSRR
jgi:hypothetical protein